jgi:hypothetical protein
MAAFNCGSEALIFGSFIILASGVFASSPSAVSSSGIRWLSVRFSGKFAIILPEREMSLVSTSMPAAFVNFLTIGSSE